MQQLATIRQVLARHIRVITEDRRANYQHEIIAGKLFAQRSDCEFQVASELGMILGEAATLATRRSIHGYPELLSESNRRRPSVGPVHIRPHH